MVEPVFTFVGFPFVFVFFSNLARPQPTRGYLRLLDKGLRPDIRLLVECIGGVAEMSDSLGASFFCSRDSEAEQPRSNLNQLIFPTLARPQLLRISIELQEFTSNGCTTRRTGRLFDVFQL